MPLFVSYSSARHEEFRPGKREVVPQADHRHRTFLVGKFSVVVTCCSDYTFGPIDRPKTKDDLPDQWLGHCGSLFTTPITG